MSVWNIVGASSDADLYFCKQLAVRITNTSEGGSIKFVNMLEVEFLDYMTRIKVEKGGAYCTYTHLHIVERDGVLVGDLMSLVNIAMTEFNMDDAEIANTILFEKSAQEETLRLIKQNNHTACYLKFQAAEGIGKEDPLEYGEIVIELFDDYAPKAAKNFISLCTGTNSKSISYIDCPIHRIVEGGWLQLGDVVDGSGANSISAVEVNLEKFEDESYSIEFGGQYGGLVGYSSSKNHSNGSQFFITLGPCEWMNNTSVGFGRVISGFKTLESMGSVTTKNERPVMPILVTSAGVYGS